MFAFAQLYAMLGSLGKALKLKNYKTAAKHRASKTYPTYMRSRGRARPPYVSSHVLGHELV